MPWIGVDLDATLAKYEGFNGPAVIGAPVPKMLARVKELLEMGVDVRIFTARVSEPTEEDVARSAIESWCLEHLGQKLPVTCKKDYHCLEIWDDRAVQVIPNTGEFTGTSRLEFVAS